MPDDSARWMSIALEEARAGAEAGEVPVGAVIVRGDQLLARTHNLTHQRADPTAHAELLAIREAADAMGDWRLSDCELYVTLEPCAMCAGALVLARIRRLVFAAADPQAGMCGSLGNIVQEDRLNHHVVVESGPGQGEAAELLRVFFRGKR